MAARETVFTHPSQLNSLSRWPFLRNAGMGQLRLGGALADHAQRAAWELALNRHYRACGCSASAKMLLLATPAGAAFAVQGAWVGRFGWGQAVLVAVAVGVAGGLLGKAWALVMAHRALCATVTDIQQHWKLPAPTGPRPPAWHCG